MRTAQSAAQTLGNTTNDSVAPTYVDRGQGAVVLRPEHQVAYQAAPTAAQTRDALIAAGVMKAS